MLRILIIGGKRYPSALAFPDGDSSSFSANSRFVNNPVRTESFMISTLLAGTPSSSYFPVPNFPVRVPSSVIFTPSAATTSPSFPLNALLIVRSASERCPNAS